MWSRSGTTPKSAVQCFSEEYMSSEQSHRRRLRAGGPGGPSRSRHSSSGYPSALGPVVSLPRGSWQSRARNQEVPRRDTSCHHCGNGPTPPPSSFSYSSKLGTCCKMPVGSRSRIGHPVGSFGLLWVENNR